MKNYSLNVFLNLIFTIIILLFVMVSSVDQLGKSYNEINAYAQTTIFSPVPPDYIPSVNPTAQPSLTPIPMQAPTSIPNSASIQPQPPGNVSIITPAFSLNNWKLTLPIGDSEEPKEIKQPELATFTLNPWFTTDQGAIRFRAAVNGVTTGGSSYPRSELREMTDEGREKASWSSTTGTHTLFLDEAITAVPQVKQHVVAGQIHDEDDDVIVIRLEYPVLYVNVDGKNKYTLDENYSLGKRFSVKFEVSGGETKIFYNGSADAVYVLNKEYSRAYFKAGAYTQSNCSKEDSSSLCNDNNYGEVIIYQVGVVHK